MQGRCNRKFRTGVIATLAAIWIAGCQTPSGAPSSVNGGRAVAQADKLSREGQYAAAAQAYEDVAAQNSAELRNRLLLRASRDWLRAENLQRGEALLKQIDQVTPADQTLLHVVTARAALLGQHPDRALLELDKIPQPLPRDDAAVILELRSKALFAYGNPAGAVITALDREQMLVDQNDVMRNRRMIWDGIQRNVAAGVNMQTPVGASRQVAGWMELGRAALMTSRNPFAAQAALDEWRGRYPEHAANDFLTKQVVPQLRTAVTYPEQIALLLPLTGRNQSFGVTVRDGLVASLMQQSSDQRPVLRVYDTANGVLPAYTQAVANGAKFVIGPLLREDVAALTQSQQIISIPTLALNSLPDDTPATDNLYSFALDPAEEAKQVAERIASDGLTHGIALLPKGERGERVHRAFAAELIQRGGMLSDVRFYDPAAVDFSVPVTVALLINESRARATTLNAVVGAKLEFEPRARSDVEFVFIGAEPQKGRLLRPALRFHMRDSVPIYSISDIFEPDPRANVDLNDVMFPDMPWMIAPDELSAQLRAAFNQYWPGRARDRARLYAFGFDAYRLAPLVMSQSTSVPTSETAGMTGRLSIDATRRVRRDLDWARITNGAPQLLEQTLRSQPIQASPPPVAAVGR